MLLKAETSEYVKTALRTSGGHYLCDHNLPESGFDDSWQFALWTGVFINELFLGRWLEQIR